MLIHLYIQSIMETFSYPDNDTLLHLHSEYLVITEGVYH